MFQCFCPRSKLFITIIIYCSRVSFLFDVQPKKLMRNGKGEYTPTASRTIPPRQVPLSINTYLISHNNLIIIHTRHSFPFPRDTVCCKDRLYVSGAGKGACGSAKGGGQKKHKKQADTGKRYKKHGQLKAKCNKCSRMGRPGGQHRAPCGGYYGGSCAVDWLRENGDYKWVASGKGRQSGQVMKTW